jgi:hypothetical protein
MISSRLSTGNSSIGGRTVKARVIDQNVQTAELAGRLFDHAGDLVRLGHIRGRIERPDQPRQAVLFGEAPNLAA